MTHSKDLSSIKLKHHESQSQKTIIPPACKALGDSSPALKAMSGISRFSNNICRMRSTNPQSQSLKNFQTRYYTAPPKCTRRCSYAISKMRNPHIEATTGLILGFPRHCFPLPSHLCPIIYKAEGNHSSAFALLSIFDDWWHKNTNSRRQPNLPDAKH